MSSEETNNNAKNFFDDHYIAITTSIGISVAFIDSILLFLMNSASISNGIGLAMVGIVTFFGMLIASSVFEEHRHSHSQSPNQPNSSEKTVANLIAGKGIMRKAIASSLIVVYIIVIGLYIENGELNEPFPGFETPTSDRQELAGNSLTSESNVELTDSFNVVALELIQDNDGGPKSETKSGNETETSAKGEESNKIAKPIPRSLLEHFTTVITAVVIFYFGSDIASNWFKSKYGSGSIAQGGQTVSTSPRTQEQQKKKISQIEKKIAELEAELEKIKKKKG